MKLIETKPVIIGHTKVVQLEDGLIASITHYIDNDYPPEIDCEGRDLTKEELDEIIKLIDIW